MAPAVTFRRLRPSGGTLKGRLVAKIAPTVVDGEVGTAAIVGAKPQPRKGERVEAEGRVYRVVGRLREVTYLAQT